MIQFVQRTEVFWLSSPGEPGSAPHSHHADVEEIFLFCVPGTCGASEPKLWSLQASLPYVVPLLCADRG